MSGATSHGHAPLNHTGSASSAAAATAMAVAAAPPAARCSALSGTETGSRPPCRRSSSTNTGGAVSTSTA